MDYLLGPVLFKKTEKGSGEGRLPQKSFDLEETKEEAWKRIS